MRSRDRQEQIVAQLLNQGSVHIMELRERFQVSEGTVRNDLRALELDGRLIRTHGGAIAIDAKRSPHPRTLTHLLDGESLDEKRQAQWQTIAHRAAELINEGDLILLSSSPITQAMVPDLLAMKSLVVLTNSIDIAQRMSQNSAHTVILIGGQIHHNRDGLDGRAAVSVLERMRVSKAFITCDGISTAQGFASNDIADAQMKSSMVACADIVVAMALPDVIGKLALMSFAALNQVHQLITTNDLPQTALNDLVSAGVRVSMCGEHITEVCADCPPDRKWRIGFANLTEEQDFAVKVRQSLERAAAQAGNIELILTNNDTNPQQASENARRMLDAKVDLVIEYQQDERTNYVLMDLFRSAKTPVVAIDIPMPGAVYFGADNFRAGRIAGDAATQWIRQNWDGKVDKIVCLEQPESGSIPAARIQGALVSLRNSLALKDSDILHYDTRGALDESRSAATQALRNIPWGRKVLFIGINANSAIGALEAADVLGRQSCTAVVSQNVTGRIRRELQARNPMLIGAVDFFPGTYGERIVSLALNILASTATAPATYTDHLLITADNIGRLYPEDKANQAHGHETGTLKRPQDWQKARVGN